MHWVGLMDSWHTVQTAGDGKEHLLHTQLGKFAKVSQALHHLFHTALQQK